MKYVYEFVPRFSDFDMLGIIHHSIYLKYVEEARINAFEEYFNIAMKSFLQQYCNVVIANVDMKYLKMIRVRKTYRIEIQLDFESGVYVLSNFEIADEDEVFVRGTMKLCFVDKEGNLLLSYPDFIKEMLQEKLESEV